MRPKDNQVRKQGVTPQAGFSFLEILFFLAIILILTLASQPFLSSYWQKQKTIQQASRLFHALQFARSEAIKRQKTVNICGSEDLQSCTSNWSKGYIVYVEHAKTREILFQEAHLLAPISSGKLTKIQFANDGRCLSRGSLFIGNVQTQQRIVIYDSGRARIETTLAKR